MKSTDPCRLTLILATSLLSVATYGAATFGQDAAFLARYTDAITLRKGSAAIVVVPDYQGRVMTATAHGDGGASTGWINYPLVEEGIRPEDDREGLQRHIYAFGGEERMWLGPEGGQFSIFFEQGADFVFDRWKTPSPLDTEPWRVTERGADFLTVESDFPLRNWSGSDFEVALKRKIRLLNSEEIESVLGLELAPQLDVVAYETDNQITNIGDRAWTPETGLLSVWLLGMFQPSPETVVFIPFNEETGDPSNSIVNDAYFGPVKPERLVVKDGLILFKADGASRGKIGISPERSLGLAGSYDPEAGRITLIHYELPADSASGYVNSLWELQSEPYAGDAINSYNDGPVEPDGDQMGPFYELESSSPALALAPGETSRHQQQTVHIYGSRLELNGFFRQLTGRSLDSTILTNE